MIVSHILAVKSLKDASSVVVVNIGCLETEQQHIEEKLSFIESMRIEKEEEQMFQNTINWRICGSELGADRLRDHCHISWSHTQRI
jgi:hypothetical protein